MAIGEWRQICGTAPASAPISVQTYPALGNTGPASKIIAWCGLSIDTRDSTVYMPANGGHTDYAGNEVNSIRLSDDAPRWIERRPSTPVSLIVPDTPYYGDNRPTSGHTYFGNQFIEARNRAICFGRATYGTRGALARTVDGFNVAIDDWDAPGTYPDLPFAREFAWAVAKHPVGEDVFVLAGFQLQRWSQTGNTWSTITTNAPVSGYEAVSAVDSQRNRILYFGGQATGPRIYNIAAQTFSSVTFTGSAAGAMSGAGLGMVYEPALDAYLVRREEPGGTVYRIDAGTFSVEPFPTTGGSGIAEAINGVYTRFLRVPQLGGIVFCPDYDSDLWFLRTV